MKILGIDYGGRRIGLAISEGEIARPLGVELRVKNYELRIKKICEKENISKIVIGISEGKMAGKSREFGESLQKATGIPVEYFDETLSTHEAIRKMVEAGTTRKKRKEFIDAVSAAIILQEYLSSFPRK